MGKKVFHFNDLSTLQFGILLAAALGAVCFVVAILAFYRLMNRPLETLSESIELRHMPTPPRARGDDTADDEPNLYLEDRPNSAKDAADRPSPTPITLIIQQPWPSKKPYRTPCRYRTYPNCQCGEIPPCYKVDPRIFIPPSHKRLTPGVDGRLRPGEIPANEKHRASTPTPRPRYHHITHR